MNSQAIFVERRKHSRDGVMGVLETITYSVLRQHGVFSETGNNSEAASPSQSRPECNRKENTTMANLTIISRNEQPKRNAQYPQTWLLFKDNETIEVHVAHDNENRPLVLDWGVA